MPRYSLDVVEVRHVPCTYVVEADTPEEAIELAKKGETIEETEDGHGNVNDRFVQGQPRELAPFERGDGPPHDAATATGMYDRGDVPG